MSVYSGGLVWFSAAAKAGLGFSALYYSIDWFVKALNLASSADKFENSDGNQVIKRANTAFSEYHGNDDPALKVVAEIVKQRANLNEAILITEKAGSFLYALGGGLMFFGATKAAKALVSGEPMDLISTVIDAGAAVGVAQTIYNKR